MEVALEYDYFRNGVRYIAFVPFAQQTQKNEEANVFRFGMNWAANCFFLQSQAQLFISSH